MMEVKTKTILYIGNNITKKTKYTTTMDTLSSLLETEGYVIYKSSSKINKFLRLIDMCFSVLKYAKRVDYMLIDTFSTSNFYYALFTSQIARFFNLKYIPILHGGNLPYRLDKSPNLSKLIFKNSYLNIAPSNYLKMEFEKRNYATKFIPNILDIDDYQFEQRINIKPKILWVRAFKELYNPLMAIRVLNELKKEFKEAELCMVGPVKDDSFQKAKDLAKEMSLLDSITLTGILPKKKWHQISKKYDVFINTTNFDNTPVSVMEAMALGLTIVSTNAGGMPYLINQGEDGIIVKKDNHLEMSKAITNLIRINNNKLSLNARAKAETFGWNMVKNQWNTIFNSK